MKKTLIALFAGVALSGAVAAQAAEVITGAGATFPYPVYSQWGFDYNKETGAQLNYQSIGSGGGIKQIKAKTVNFGASDAPLTADELKEAGLVQFPMIMGGVVPVVKIAGIQPGQLKLTGDLLAGIFLGKVTRWDDARIKALNPGLALPGTQISVVHRADGSGTTWVFTNYLSKVSPEWKSKVGNDKSVAWPVGVGGKGNEGVAAFVQKMDGTIGYVEYAYALQNKMAHAALKNHDGQFVQPTADSFAAAAAGADWVHTPGFAVVLTDQPGRNSWPIAGASFILMHAKQDNPAKAQSVLKFFDWSYRNGAKAAEKLDYVAIPESVANLVRKGWEAIGDANGKPVWPAR